MNETLVSIILSLYNAGKWLADSLQSSRGQSVADVEVIAVDDGSSDGSLGIWRAFAGRDPRLKILVNEKNRGQAAPRNMGINLSTGRWIAFLDNDDVLDPDFCRVLLAGAEKSGADIGKGRPKIVGLGGTTHETPRQCQHDVMAKSQMSFNEAWWTAIYHAGKIRAKVRLHDEAWLGENWLFLAEAVSLPLKVPCDDDIVYINIQRENSGGAYRNRPLKKIEACIAAAASILQTLNERNAYDTDPCGYRVWAREALRRLGGFHRASKDERETALALCAARAPQIPALIRCEYPGVKEFLMALLLKVLSDGRLRFARLLLFRCCDAAKRIRPARGH